MKILRNRGLDLWVRDPNRITSAIKESKYISKHESGLHRVLVKWTLSNVRMLANMGIRKSDVPSPIMKHYHWPGTFTPYDHQKHTAGFLTANDRCYCFNDQGTGKTSSAIWAADYLLEIGDIKNVLIVCPLSIMNSAWGDELFNLTMHRTVAVAYGSKAKRIDIINTRSDFTIINFDGVKTVPDTLRAMRFDLIIIDELTQVKTATTDRWKMLNSLVRPDTKIWGMTGTPAAQSPLDAYGICKMVTPTRVPKYFGSWRDRVMRRVSQFTWLPAPDAEKLVHAALSPAIRYIKKDCLDLPPVTYVTRDVPLTAQQEKYYRKLKNEMRMEAAGETITAVHAAAGMIKLLQLSTGTVFSDTGDVIKFDASTRLKTMMEIIDDTDHKVIVFAPFRHTIDVIEAHIQSKGYTTDIIRGGVSLVRRTKIISDFQRTKDPHVLIIQPQSAAHGVTLTAAATIIWFGPTNSLETWLQANERINRPSQDNKMTIVKLTGSQIERKVYNALEHKDTAQKSLVALYEAELQSATI